MKRPNKRQMYSASVFSLVIALIFTVIHFYSGWQAAIASAQEHNQSAHFYDYLIVWTRDFTENMQTEMYQIAVQFAILSGVFAFLGVVGYEDDNQEMKEALHRLEEDNKQIKKTLQSMQQALGERSE